MLFLFFAVSTLISSSALAFNFVVNGRSSANLMIRYAIPRSNSESFTRDIKRCSKLIPLLLTPLSVRAGLFTSAEQDALNDISGYQKVVAELLDQLKPMPVNNAVGVSIPTQILKGGKEDSNVVRN